MVRYKKGKGINSAKVILLSRQSQISQAIKSNTQKYAQPPQQLSPKQHLLQPQHHPYAHKSQRGVIYGKSSTGKVYAYQAAPNESPPHPHAPTPRHGLFKTVQDNGNYVYTTNQRDETFVLTPNNSPIRTNDTLLQNGQWAQPKPLFKTYKKFNNHKPSRKNGYSRYPKSTNKNRRKYPKKQNYKQQLHQQRNKSKSYAKQRRFHQHNKVKYT